MSSDTAKAAAEKPGLPPTATIDGDRDSCPLKFTFFANRLRTIGIETEWQAERFLELWSQICNRHCTWNGTQSGQKSYRACAYLARNPRFDPLPLWVRAALCESDFILLKYEKGRWMPRTRGSENIWRYFHGAKAWRWCPALPKQIAEKIGKMPPRYRPLAALSWTRIFLEQNPKERFWKELQTLAKQSVWDDQTLEDAARFWSPAFLPVALEVALNLERDSLRKIWQERHLDTESYIDIETVNSILNALTHHAPHQLFRLRRS